MSRPRIVLGLDPGSRRTGYGVLRGPSGPDGIARLTSGFVQLDATRPFAERLPQLRVAIVDLIQMFHPEEAVLETCFLSRGVRAALVLGHVRGALLLVCLDAGLSVFEYAPGEIKRAVTGNGGASKEQVERMLPRLVVGAPIRPGADESDAIAVAYCHLSRTISPSATGAGISR